MSSPSESRAVRRATLAVTLALAISSCASVSFTRETETSGRFQSSGIAFTLLSFDFPKRAIDIARENASDARQPNMQVDRERIFPSLGPFDWLLDIIGIRYAKVSGSWGFAPSYEETSISR